MSISNLSLYGYDLQNREITQNKITTDDLEMNGDINMNNHNILNTGGFPPKGSELKDGLYKYWDMVSNEDREDGTELLDLKSEPVIYGRNPRGLFGFGAEFTQININTNTASFSNDVVLGNNDFSISLWFIMDNAYESDAKEIFAVGDNTNGFYIGREALQNGQLYIQGSNFNKVVFTGTEDKIKPNLLYNMVLTRQGQNIKVYLNGISIFEDEDAKYDINLSSKFYLGADVDETSQFDGIMTDVGLWKDRILTLDDVELLYNNGNGIRYGNIINDERYLRIDGENKMWADVDINGFRARNIDGLTDNLGNLQVSDPEQPLKRELASYWNFETDNDLVGSNDLSLEDGATVGNTGGDIGGGFYLDASGSGYASVDVDWQNIIGFNDFSLSYWSKPLSQSTGSLNANSIIGWDGSGANRRFALLTIGDGEQARLTFRTNTGETSSTIVNHFLDFEPPLNQWVHYCLVRRANIAYIYINGILNNTIDYGYTADVSSNNFGIGAIATGQNPANIEVAEVGIYVNKLLSNVEVQALYNRGKGLAFPLNTSLVIARNNTQPNLGSIDVNGASITNLNTDSDLINGISSYWRFIDTGDDVGSNNLTLNAGATLGTGGDIGSGFYLDTSLDTAYASVSELVGAEKFSMSFWLYVDDFIETSADRNQIFLWFDASTRIFRMEYHDTTGELTMGIRSSTSGAASTHSLNFFLAKEQWYHIVVTRNESIVSVYINGTLIDSGFLSDKMTFTPDSQFYLSGNVSVVRGKNRFAEVGIWVDRILTLDDVQELYNSGIGLTFPLQVVPTNKYSRYLPTEGGKIFGDVEMRGGFKMNGFDLDMNTYNITNLDAPVNDNDATRKTYVDTADNLRLLKGGDTMGGNLNMDNNDITGIKELSLNSNNHIIDGSNSSYLSLNSNTGEIEVYRSTGGAENVVFGIYSDVNSLRNQEFYFWGGGDFKAEATVEATDFITSSDQRYKTNITNVNDEWDKFKSVKLHNYDYKKGSVDRPNQYGVIAQELKEIYPEVVEIKEDKNYSDAHSVNTTSLFMRACKVIQELQMRVEQLENKS